MQNRRPFTRSQSAVASALHCASVVVTPLAMSLSVLNGGSGFAAGSAFGAGSGLSGGFGLMIVKVLLGICVPGIGTPSHASPASTRAQPATVQNSAAKLADRMGNLVRGILAQNTGARAFPLNHFLTAPGQDALYGL